LPVTSVRIEPEVIVVAALPLASMAANVQR